MEDGLSRWYKAPVKVGSELSKRRQYVAQLVNKSVMHDYARKNNIPLPTVYGNFQSVDDIDFSTLPDRVVIKPNNSADSDCVLLLAGDRELLSGSTVPVENRSIFVKDAFSKGRFLNAQTTIIAEEFLCDYDPCFNVPRDFKVYVAGGRAHLIQVIDRNGPKPTWNQSFYDRDWRSMPSDFQQSYAPGPKIATPDRLSNLIDVSERIARDIGCFMRLDFFVSPDRVVFGEFTSYPFAGRRFSAEADRFLCNLLEQYPDPF